MPQSDSTAADQRRATVPRIAHSDAPHDDPPPAGPQAVAAPASSAPAEEKPPNRDWPIVVVYRDGGSIFVIPAARSSEPVDTPCELVLALVDRAGLVRSSRCTCAFFGREGTCTHVWEADFELAAQQGRMSS